jgi:hypothetical protein
VVPAEALMRKTGLPSAFRKNRVESTGGEAPSSMLAWE